MAGEVTPQGEGARSLHLRKLRVQWQIVTLQVLATPIIGLDVYGSRIYLRCR